jgi:hypothetical protein
MTMQTILITRSHSPLVYILFLRRHTLNINRSLVNTLINRYIESTSMVEETNNYYDKITSSIDATDIAEWTAAIQDAEKRRLEYPAAMDLLGAQRRTSSISERLDASHESTIGEDWCRLALSIEERQIDVQDRVRRLGKEPREVDRREVERLREILVAELSQMHSLENQALLAIPQTAIAPTDNEDVELFDNLDEGSETVVPPSDQILPSSPNPVSISHSQTQNSREELIDVGTPITIPALPSSDHTPTMISPEQQQISMPSNSLQDHPLRDTELSLRKQQADRYLNALRETIAEKSFHYSHVLRIAPKKSVRTRARAIIAKLNESISLYSRIYTRCRVALVRLHADEALLGEFQILRKEDVHASTAILDPNIPGSTSVRLSWIWQTSGSEENQTPEQVRECK